MNRSTRQGMDLRQDFLQILRFLKLDPYSAF